MRPNILERAYQLDVEFGRLLEDVAERRFDFTFLHSPYEYRYHYEYFWFVEMYADAHLEIDARFRAGSIHYVLARWRANLRGYRPYQDMGYYIYMWETLAPKLGVMPLSHANEIGRDQEFDVKTIEEFVQPYQGRSWREIWAEGAHIRDKDILKAVRAENGSIGTRTSRRLGVNVAELRRLIESWDVSEEVNRIRKANRRRPAQLVKWSDRADVPHRVYSEIWPKNY